MVKFELGKKVNKLDSPEDAIRSVITDKYFREAAKDDAKKNLQTKARTISWALTFFIMNRKLDQVMRYFQELSNLPRDLEFDDDTLMLVFGRAFELVDPADPYHVNPNKLDKLAEEWYSYIELTPIESSEAMQDAIKRYEQQKKNTGRAASNTPTNPQSKQPPKINVPKIIIPKGKGK